MARVIAFVALMAVLLPVQLRAEDSFIGTWQPFSKTTLFWGALTVQTDRVTYAEGMKAGLAPVRDGGSVFQLVNPEGEAFKDCGADPVTYVGFRVLSDGQLAVLHYGGNAPPNEPTGNDPMAIIQNGACSVSFYER
ncbi:hypothetical protein [Ruegeria lacuscaerulensis]|uniref:hypothetical protein n=1 Tax=Ruegeria lacuscaerulensis TaxID=55218 RepID=UPI00148043C9|nr:hypothetical protein [Ruegeria lacuscaerulensis]